MMFAAPTPVAELPSPMDAALRRLDDALSAYLRRHREAGTDPATCVRIRRDVMDIAAECRREGDIMGVAALTTELHNAPIPLVDAGPEPACEHCGAPEDDMCVCDEEEAA